MPSEMSCAKETRDLIIDCCVGEHDMSGSSIANADIAAEFVHLLSSEANDVCEKGSKKTIAPEHVVTALKVSMFVTPLSWSDADILHQDLGFEAYTTEVEDVLKEHKVQQKVSLCVFCSMSHSAETRLRTASGKRRAWKTRACRSRSSSGNSSSSLPPAPHATTRQHRQAETVACSGIALPRGLPVFIARSVTCHSPLYSKARRPLLIARPRSVALLSLKLHALE